MGNQKRKKKPPVTGEADDEFEANFPSFPSYASREITTITIAEEEKHKASLLRDQALAHYSGKTTLDAPAAKTARNAERQRRKERKSPRRPNPKLGETSSEREATLSAAAGTPAPGPIDLNGDGKNTLPGSHTINLATGKKTKNSNQIVDGKSGDKAVDTGTRV